MEFYTSEQIATMQHRGHTLPGEVGRTIGMIGDDSQLFVYGPQGSGKSTLALVLAQMLAAEVGLTIYVSAEERTSITLTKRTKRLGTGHPDLGFVTYSGLLALKAFLAEVGARAVIVDSISAIDPTSTETVDFLRWCRNNKIAVVLVAHATKAGGYRGATTGPHEVDFVGRVFKVIADDEEERQENPHGILYLDWAGVPNAKNRLGGEPYPARIPANASEMPTLRENPVRLPFTTTLGEILDTHSVRSVKRLRALLSDKTSCIPSARRYSHDGTPGPLAFRYERDTPRRKSELTVLHKGKVAGTICAASLRACIKELKDEWGSTKVEITDQKHARMVLGAREYKKQERAQAAEARKERSQRVQKARKAVAKGERPAPGACSAAASELAENGTSKAGKVLRPCDDEKPVRKTARKAKRKPKAKATKKRSAKKATPKKAATKKRTPRKKPSTKAGPKQPAASGGDGAAGDAAILDALSSIQQQIETL